MDMREQLYMLEIEKHRIKDAAQALHISHGKQFVPTEAGKIYLEHTKEMIKIEAHYENELQKYMGGSSGTIRFGIHPRRTLYLLAKALPVFSARYPDVKLIPYEESTEQMIRHLLAGELDFAIVNESSAIRCWNTVLSMRTIWSLLSPPGTHCAPARQKPERSMSEDRSQTI